MEWKKMAANPEDIRKRNVRNSPAKQHGNIAGLDLSLTGTGFCGLDTLVPDVSTILYITTIDTEKMRGIDRMLFIEDTIKNLLNEYFIKLIFVEGFSFKSKGKAVFDIGGLGWVIRRLLTKECQIPYYLVPPKTLKMFVTGNGNAGKPLMLEQTYRRWNIGSEILKDDNQVDAFGLCKIGQAYLEWKDGKEDFTKKQLQALKAVE